MTEVSDYTNGTPNWVDVASPDPEATRKFYGDLFGWEYNVMGPEAGGYAIALLNGKDVAGVGPIMGENQPPMWSTYVKADDADAAAKAVESAGGKVYMAPFDVMEAGRMGVFADSTGAVFSVWQPGQHKGAAVVNEAGAFCWNELNTRDLDGAKEFYRSVFGWVGETSGTEGMQYTEWKLDGKTIGGMMDMGDRYPAEVPAFWLVYFAVDDTDTTVAKTTSAGGKALAPAMDTPAGRIAVLSDPAGINFGVITLLPS